jgi:archaetidylinositol phosphate synthase
MVSSRLRSAAEPYIVFIARPIAKTGLNPSFLTLIGLGFSVLAGFMYATHNLIFAFLALLVASITDVLDGNVARISKRVTAFGGFLDSLVDRYSEAFILIGIGLFLGGHFILVFIVLAGSFLVSYSRARAELEIEKCDVGIGERAERLIILMAATIIHATDIIMVNALYWALVLLAILTHLTVAQRAWFTYKKLEH